MIKINILWTFDTVGGGGNQFLRTLRRYLKDSGVYEEDPYKADVVLVNSKDCLEEAKTVKRVAKNKIVHRIDGIFSIYRGEHERYNDDKVYAFAKDYADGVIFQSKWSQQASIKNGMLDHPNKIIIYNCADNKYFVRTPKKEDGKIRLVTSSWSNNIKKGFYIYQYLDSHLDFSKFEYSFAGRSPFSFKNIKMEGVLNSADLFRVLNLSDIFITATEDDACSNSLIEALTCGLPAVALNSGGSSEIVKSGGEIFESKNDIIDKITMVADNLVEYRNKIEIDGIDIVGKYYYNFMQSLC